MKKILIYFVCFITAFGTLCFTSCKDEVNGDSVKLVAISGGDVGRIDGCDYYVVPEPSASTKVSAVKNLDFAGNLQTLYGGDKGYPQAIIVAKNSLLETDFVAKFLREVKSSCNWIKSDASSAQTIVSAVQSHLTDGMTPTFSADNLTKSVISNCGINLTYAHDDKREILSFIQRLNAVSDGFGTPADSFFKNEDYDAALYQGTVKIYVPDGAPALGLAKLLNDNWACDGAETEYNVVNAATVQTYVTGANPKADICVLPVNLAVKLLGGGEKYKAVATLTHGNLFLLKNGEKSNISAENISSLRGKTVGVVNLAQVPGLTFKVILNKFDIEYTEIV